MMADMPGKDVNQCSRSDMRSIRHACAVPCSISEVSDQLQVRHAKEFKRCDDIRQGCRMLFGCSGVVLFVKTWQRSCITTSDSMQTIAKDSFAIHQVVKNLSHVPSIWQLHTCCQLLWNRSPELTDFAELRLKDTHDIRFRDLVDISPVKQGTFIWIRTHFRAFHTFQIDAQTPSAMISFFANAGMTTLHCKQLQSCIAEKILEQQNCKNRRLTSRGSPVSGIGGRQSPDCVCHCDSMHCHQLHGGA